jgi:hypothetical protein
MSAGAYLQKCPDSVSNNGGRRVDNPKAQGFFNKSAYRRGMKRSRPFDWKSGAQIRSPHLRTGTHYWPSDQDPTSTMKTKSWTPMAVDLPPTDTINRLNRSRPNLIAAAHTSSNGPHGPPILLYFPGRRWQCPARATAAPLAANPWACPEGPKSNATRCKTKRERWRASWWGPYRGLGHQESRPRRTAEVCGSSPSVSDYPCTDGPPIPITQHSHPTRSGEAPDPTPKMLCQQG